MAGRRPVSKGDDGTPSRHRLVEQLASLVLMFNCANAAFEVVKWSGDTDFDKLPGEQQFDMVSLHSRKQIGVVRLPSPPLTLTLPSPKVSLKSRERSASCASTKELGMMI